MPQLSHFSPPDLDIYKLMKPQDEQELKDKITRYSQQKNYVEAAKLAMNLVEQNPKNIEAWWVLAQLQSVLGRVEDAIRSYYQVCQAPSPVYAQAVERAVKLSVDNELWSLGVAPAQELVKILPKEKSSWYSAGLCWYMLGAYIEAEPYFDKALRVDPNCMESAKKLAFVYFFTARQGLAVKKFQELCSACPENLELLQCLAFVSNYCASLDEAQIKLWHEDMAALLKEQKYPARKVLLGDKVLRLAFLSADLKRHSVAFFLLPLLRGLDRTRWDITCYSDSLTLDEFSDEIREISDSWFDVSEMDDEALSDKIRGDAIDILIDLQGLTGDARSGVYSRRVSPVQASYLGYPNTTGLQNIDFRLTDESSDPLGETESHYSESLIRVEKGFLCFEPFGLEEVECSDLPALSAERVTFASFNAFQKVTPEVIKVWARILMAVPNSRLLLKSKPLQGEGLKEKVEELFQAFGVESDRLELVGWTKNQSEHLALYRKVDIHLDTFPYNGTTTTCEALWQGVPTVSLAGGTHRSRVGKSILDQVSLDDWVAGSEKEYIKIAVEKASNLDALADLRRRLRSTMLESPLMDQKGFGRRFEKALFNMISQHNQKL